MHLTQPFILQNYMYYQPWLLTKLSIILTCLISFLASILQIKNVIHFKVPLITLNAVQYTSPYLGSQQARQVDLGDHLAAAVALPLVRVVVVLHQVPEFGAALQVWSDHGRPRAKAVWTAGRSQHALCGHKHWMVGVWQVGNFGEKYANKL